MTGSPQDQAAGEQAVREAQEALAAAQWAEQAGVPERAIAEYRKIVRLFPASFEIHTNLASLLLAQGRPDEALVSALAAHAVNPDDPIINANLGQAYLRTHQPELAVPCLWKTLAKQPELHPLRKMLADALLYLGRSDEAVAVFDEVRDRYPSDLALLVMMASFYYRARKPVDAEKCFQRLLELAPQRAATYNDLAQLYVDFAQFSKAKDICLRGLQIEPDAPVLWNTLANSQACLGLGEQSLQSYRKVLELAPDLAAAHSNMLLSMHYSSEVDPQEIVAEHRRWGERHAPAALATQVFPNTPDPQRRLRIGYISPDIRQHSVAFFLEPLLDNRDRAGFEVFGYGTVKSPDAVTERLRGKFDQYRAMPNLGDAEIAGLIKADQVDILVDLAVHAGNVHAVVLAHRPAPVQVNYCGYPDTTGIAAVGYRLTDWISDPEGVEGEYTERLVRLPGGFLCFRPPEELPEIGDPPGLTRGYATFGSFNREFKFSQKTYDLWCRILRAVPGSRMVVKSLAGGDPGARKHLLDQFESRGVPAERVQLVGFIAQQKQHLAWYREVDVALDTFPYHGTTTTLDSLLMGVPVITLAGYNHASRVGESLLTQVGLPDFIAYSEDEYVARAIELASDLRHVRELHGTLRQRLLSSPLCDAPGFMRKYEFALRGMWCNWCREQGVALSAEQAAMAAFDFTALGLHDQ